MKYSCCLSILAKEISPELTRLYLSLAHPLWLGYFVFIFLVLLETIINGSNSKVNLEICVEVTKRNAELGIICKSNPDHMTDQSTL